MLFTYLKEKMLKTPDCIICDENKSISFRELIEYAENNGQKLEHDKYGILCKTELNTAKALMSCLYAQKTAVLMSDRYGKQHSGKIISTIKLSYIMTDEGIKKVAEEQPETEDLSDVAFIMCTSGTTGNPKGAMITEDNLITNIEDINQFLKYEKNNNILIIRSLYHCSALTGEFFMSLVRGVNIFFLNNNNPCEVYNIIEKRSINIMCGTPTLIYNLSRLTKRRPSLSILVCSGECMTETVAKEIRVYLPNTQIYNIYGLTEASPRVSYLPPELFDSHPASVGIFLNSLSGKILNGELLIKGKSIMKGYYNDPVLTLNTIKDGWLHTGDLASIENGLLYIKCRKDNLIIKNGMNIYPQEIENAIKRDKRITEAYAFGESDRTYGQKIHLVVEASDCVKKDVLEICLKQLPYYQMPDIIEITDCIAKNATGKVIRNRKQGSYNG